MPKSMNYVDRDNRSGEYNCHIRPEVNNLLDVYCRLNGINKAQYVNSLVERDMAEKFAKVKEA